MPSFSSTDFSQSGHRRHSSSTSDVLKALHSILSLTNYYKHPVTTRLQFVISRYNHQSSPFFKMRATRIRCEYDKLLLEFFTNESESKKSEKRGPRSMLSPTRRQSAVTLNNVVSAHHMHTAHTKRITSTPRQSSHAGHPLLSA